MKRTVYSLMLVFLATGTICAQQKIEEMAKELWRNFPTECEVNYSTFLSLTLKIPMKKVRPSLVDSLEAAFISESHTADYVSMVKRDEDNGCSMNYTLLWKPNKTPDKPQDDSFHGHPWVGNIGSALLDNKNDSLYFEVGILTGFGWHNAFSAGITKYEVPELDRKLKSIRNANHTKSKKLKLKGNSLLCDDVVGYKYEITCDADKLYEEMMCYIIDEYVLPRVPYVGIKHFDNTHQYVVSLYGLSPQQQTEERVIAFYKQNDKLVVVDLTNQHHLGANEIHQHIPTCLGMIKQQSL